MIALDPGHGGKDPGAVYYHKIKEVECKFVEKVLNDEIVCLLWGMIEDFDEEPIDTGADMDYFVPLKERCRIVNEHGAKAFISVHCNSVPFVNPYGTELWIYKYSKRSEALAESIEAKLKPIVPKWRGIKRAYVEPKDKPKQIYVLKHTAMPAVLIECGFISNKDEAILLSLTDYQQKLAQGIAKGIEEWL